jgi:hypothetical protein
MHTQLRTPLSATYVHSDACTNAQLVRSCDVCWCALSKLATRTYASLCDAIRKL